MNGRIYDAKIARFLQADLIIQDPLNTQSLNRHSYIWNNPLNTTDPSGLRRSSALDWRRGRAMEFSLYSCNSLKGGKRQDLTRMALGDQSDLHRHRPGHRFAGAAVFCLYA